MTEKRTDKGIFLPSGTELPEAKEPATEGLYLPPGTDFEIPEERSTPPGEPEYTAADYAKSSCKYCHGKGAVQRENLELRATEEVLCTCVESRLNSGKGPRRNVVQSVKN